MPYALQSTPKLRATSALPWLGAPRPAALAATAFRLVDLWLSRAAQRRALAELDDRLLADVGISRVEAERECGRRFWE